MDVSKVEKYESFLNDVLRVDLQKEVKVREKICEQLAIYSQLSQTIDCISKLDTTEGLLTQVNLGSNFYAQAKIPDTSRIYVNVGLGLYVELTLSESKKVAEKKVSELNEKLEDSSKRSVKLKGQIKFVVEALKELHTHKLSKESK